MKKLIIIGSGPAGISASLYAKMSGADTTIIGTTNTSLASAEKISNYYGFEDGISGKELFENGIKQAKNIGAVFAEEEVVSIGFEDNYTVTTPKNTYTADAIILATGKSRNKAKIKNFSKFEGKGISYCAVCDGFFYKNKNIGIIGAGEYALHEYEYLKNIAASVTVFADGEAAHAELINAIPLKVSEFYGEERLEGIKLESGETYQVDGVFIAKGSADAGAIAKSIGILTEDGSIVTDENGETNVPGIFAAGDCTGGLAQISKAVYQGMRAGMAASKYLKQK